MADTPYCPLLSIGKDVPVPCQEELCMLYVKQLKLCSITVMGYTNAINMQTQTGSSASPQKPASSGTAATTGQKPKLEAKPQSNPFAMDDLE